MAWHAAPSGGGGALPEIWPGFRVGAIGGYAAIVVEIWNHANRCRLTGRSVSGQRSFFSYSSMSESISCMKYSATAATRPRSGPGNRRRSRRSHVPRRSTERLQRQRPLTKRTEIPTDLVRIRSPPSSPAGHWCSRPPVTHNHISPLAPTQSTRNEEATFTAYYCYGAAGRERAPTATTSTTSKNNIHEVSVLGQARRYIRLAFGGAVRPPLGAWGRDRQRPTAEDEPERPGQYTRQTCTTCGVLLPDDADDADRAITG